MTNLSEWQANQIRHWKAEIWDYDHYIPDDSGSCLYCLTEKEAELLRGIIIPIAWKTRWFSPTDTPTNQDLIEQFRDNLIRKLMMPCGCDDTGNLHRYSPEGHYQTSSDSGATWTDDTPGDTRTPIPMFPPFVPPGTVDVKCTYADSVVTLLKTGFVDALADGSDYTTILGALVAVMATLFVGLLPTGVGAIVVAVAGAVIALIIALGVPAFHAAMTTAVWDRFKCNLYCHMNSDGTFTQAQADAIWNQIIVDESGLAAIFLQAFVATARAIGLTNAARSGNGHPDADCSACCPACNTPEWQVYGARGEGGGFLYGTETARDSISVTVDSVSSGGGQIVIIWTNDPTICCAVATDTSGVAVTTSWIPCGGTFPVTTGIYAPSDCTYLLQLQALVPFTCVFTMNAC